MLRFGLLVLAVAIVALWIAAHRARELCVISVRGGRVLVMRGGLTPALQAALSEIVERAGTERGTIRVVRDGERARVEGTGLDEHALQRARNVVGTYPLPRLLSGRRRLQPNLGQRLGLTWLAWRLAERQAADKS